MYKVAICDDELIVAEKIAYMARAILEEMTEDYSIDIFTKGEEIINRLKEESTTYHIILLDIIMDGIDGINVATELRENGINTTIVFITSVAEFAIKGYEVQAFRYLLKPLNNEELRKALMLDYKHNYENKYLSLIHGAEVRKIPLDDVFYVEISGRKIAIHLLDDVIYYSEKLSDFQQYLPCDDFIRCHRSFIINISKVSIVKRYEAIMNNEKSVPVSKANFDNVRKKLLGFLGR
ncbi:LytR/AlgR family response regulator transcription factor [Vallitalea sp.]|jgi:DNA-binding LytR/AlgR family response regulator|uniref:LytR/AlgR family response regulator transcription factor n=1 Tax=Vallitalea sp. TaxID=1882829 RepID=UPI0025D16287|nr:LytTR family DNA-binding domain-containing protein [Vallitalea sp.]MCT4687273.1 LytTR family DNA-binding domain-containing protein [Vallitalea sp.]